ncbi:MAG: hypothetical protein II903_06980 [Spirochaetales bacterium]|nr:hypothetical protein [Spirochaetales bacterium]
MPKRHKANAVMTLISAIILVAVALVCAFPLIGLQEGSFLYAVLNPAHDFLDRSVNFFASSGLSRFGLIPLVLLCALNLVMALMGSGILQFLLRTIAFYSLYLLGAFIQGGGEAFPVLGMLPKLYPLIAAATLILSILLLVLILRVKHRARKPQTEDSAPVVRSYDDAPAAQPESPSESQFKVIDQKEEKEEQEEAPIQQVKVDPASYKKAVGSLTEVHIPEFQTFPNYDLTASVSSVDRGMFDVAEREARIRYEEQKKREAEIERQRQEEERRRRIAEQEERERLEAVENRKRLQNMFKPRNLMRRLNEDAEAAKSFPTFSADFQNIDFGISEKKPEPEPVAFEPAPEPAVEHMRPVAPQFVPQDRAQDIPVAQRMSPYAFASQTAEEEPAVQSSSVFKEATAQAELDAELVMRKRQAELERKHIEEMQQLEQQRREAEEAARKAEEQLAAARAEIQRQQEEAAAAKAAASSVSAFRSAPAAKVQPEPEPEPEPEEEEEDGISDADMAANDAKEKSKGPDVDYVSGVAGLKSSLAGNSYLLDKQKFDYKFPPESILKHYPISAKIYEDPENDPDGQTIVETFRQFRIETSIIGVQHGPTFTLYELSLAKGIKVSSVLAYSENIAMELSVEDVRILAPIPGKPAIGVEVPNKKRDTIGFDVMMPALKAKYYKIPMVLGQTITGDSIVIDVAKTPHLLVAGTTGSGKSVCINGLICSVLYTKTPKDVRMILVDPKMVELSLYNGIPHLLTPVITDAKKALKAMNFVVEEMERRMALFSSIGAKKIEEYNEKIVEKSLARVKLPYIMVIIDEFADLMLAVGKELETSIKRITAVARFCGIHLILATQRPSADVITGIIKSNIPTQIAFAVSNSTNSRIIIDQVGAEKLLGRGDMLYNNPESRQPVRIQGAFIDSEIEEIVSFVKTQGEPDYIDESYFEDDDEDEEEEDEETSGGGGSEDLFSRAWKIVTDRGEASASYLQRKLGIGYNRAANLIEQMEEAGYIGPARGSKPREILKFYGSE